MTQTHQVLGDYTILKQIGIGSLGTVFLAEHRFIKKQFILKVLPEELSKDRQFIQRFEEEVSWLASLDHPHIVKIHNISFAEGVYFIVSDYIVDSIGEATNLGQYMSGRKEKLKEEELIRLAKQIADALDYAHQKCKPGEAKGMVHGTLKLSNILVSKGRPGIEVQISDFGLSKIVGPNLIVSRCYSAMAEALGIPLLEARRQEERYFPFPIEVQKLSKLNFSFLQSFAFLAPEQKRPENYEQNSKVDIYAFGVLIYYLICGKYPEGFFEMPSQIAPEYKRNWDELIKQCLHSNPEKRPSSLTSLLDSLQKEEGVNISVEQHLKSPQLSQVLENKIQAVEVSEIVEVIKAEEPALAAAIAIKAPPLIEEETAAVAQILSTAKEPAVSYYQYEEKNKKNIESIPSDMISISSGYFSRGSHEGNRDEMPRHQVFIPAFALDIHPVTNEQFVRFLDFMGGEKDANYHDIIRLKDSRIKRAAGKLSIESGYGKHPVVGVTWYGAIAYANWVNKRLPTEAEWEIAAYGGNENAVYPSGMTIEKNQANFFSSDTTAVMSYLPNDYGLYDMAGNVYEWCQDWYGYNYYEASALEPHSPKGPAQGVYRVLRGGCWKSLKEDLRCAHRHRNNPGAVNGTYGFRCAIDLSQ